jgi:regulator of protease activity HflC (stomatin/prohibitin superfamily)
MNAQVVSLRDDASVKRRPTLWWRFVERHLPTIVIYLMVATLVGVILAPYVLVTVPSGYVGVQWKRFGGGTVLDPRKLKDEGMRFILPWNRLFLYDLRLQSATETYNAISRDGISLTAAINIRYRLKRESIPQLHQTIGPNYVEALVGPEIGNRMREVIAQYSAEDVYSTKRAEIQSKIRERAEAMLGEKMMVGGESEEEYSPYRVPLYAMLNLIDTLILGIELPSAVVTAINRKIEQYYISEEYKFRVAREIRESERKKIEAEGIAEFQRIVSQGISSSYLRWRGIEATLQLAQSSNSKVVIIGAGQNSMPIILGNLDSPSPSQPTASGTSAATGPKERTTAATPTTPSEQLPADTLPKPSEKTPSVSRQPTEKAPSASAPPSEKTSPASAQPPEAPRTYSSPISWSEIKALFARLAAALHSSSTEETPPQSPAAPTRAAEAPPQSERASPEQPYPSEPGPPPRRTMGDDVPMPNMNARPWPAPPPPDARDRSGRGRF